MSKSADFLSGTGRLSGAFVIGGDVWQSRKKKRPIMKTSLAG
jgi:hypothetical protein